jgi:predicted phosphodiesterase
MSLDTSSEASFVLPEPKARPPLTERQRRVRYLARSAALGVLLFVLSLIGSGVAVTLFGSHTYRWRAFEISAGIQPSLRGETRLVFTPLGEVRAKTHRTPVALTIGLSSISFEDLKQLIASPPPKETLEKEFVHTARKGLQNLAIRQTILGALGALTVPLLFRLRKLRYWVLCAAWGAGFVAIMFFGTVRTFNKTAFESPTYTGSLRQAEWIITLVKDGFNKVEALSDKLRHVADNLNTLYSRINAVPGFAADIDTIRILHISDIHNNQAAVRFVQELADKTGVDAVVDTGDLTDFGTPLETALSKGVGALKMPYLFVAGNHDSQATVTAVRANKNAAVLEGSVVSAVGLTFLGEPDPVASRAGAGSVDTPLSALSAASARLAAAYASAAEPPDVVCVHNPVQAQALIGKAKIIMCGHEHRSSIIVRDNTVICNAGTTGAAGARYFERKEGVAFTAAILTFAKSSTPRPTLLFIDQVELDGSLGQYSIRRKSFNNAAAAMAADGASPREPSAGTSVEPVNP